MFRSLRHPECFSLTSPFSTLDSKIKTSHRLLESPQAFLDRIVEFSETPSEPEAPVYWLCHDAVDDKNSQHLQHQQSMQQLTKRRTTCMYCSYHCDRNESMPKDSKLPTNPCRAQIRSPDFPQSTVTSELDCFGTINGSTSGNFASIRVSAVLFTPTHSNIALPTFPKV